MATTLKVLTDTVLAPSLFPDTVWDGLAGDYAPAAPTEPSNRGGLRARAPLDTAILLCLMSDARADPSDDIPDGSGDPRGWAGDLVDPAAAPLGSKLWLLRRSTLSQDVADLAVLYARKALQTLIDQGACASIDVSAKMNLDSGRLQIVCRLYKSDGSVSASQNFDLLWQQSQATPYPLDP